MTKEHRAMLLIETLHAVVVVTVVIAATSVYIAQPSGFPQDLLGFVYGGAITYAGGRAAASRGVLQRRGDSNDTEGDG